MTAPAERVRAFVDVYETQSVGGREIAMLDRDGNRVHLAMADLRALLAAAAVADIMMQGAPNPHTDDDGHATWSVPGGWQVSAGRARVGLSGRASTDRVPDPARLAAALAMAGLYADDAL